MESIRNVLPRRATKRNAVYSTLRITNDEVTRKPLYSSIAIRSTSLSLHRTIRQTTVHRLKCPVRWTRATAMPIITILSFLRVDTCITLAVAHGAEKRLRRIIYGLLFPCFFSFSSRQKYERVIEVDAKVTMIGHDP